MAALDDPANGAPDGRPGEAAEGRSDPVPVLDAEAARQVVSQARRIAVVGASPFPWRASSVVMAYLLEQGIDCVPINPEAKSVLGKACHPTLAAAVEATGGLSFDIVDVFRRAEHCPDIARAAVAAGCRTLWLQQGIVSWEAARIAHDGGLAVVMSRCTAVDLREARRFG